MKKNTIYKTAAQDLTIGFIGNPNCGKTTLFNTYTGANLKVANWPGVTVEKKESRFLYHNQTYRLVDLPGTYSLTSFTMEEQVAREYILSSAVDVIINVADASLLERSLYLTLQLIELQKPVILALNMMDVVQKRGIKLDIAKLSALLGIPIVPVSAKHKSGLDMLMHEAARFKNKNRGGADTIQAKSACKKPPICYSAMIEEKISTVTAALQKKYPKLKNPRWYALKILENDPVISEAYPLHIHKTNYEKQIISQRFNFIETIIKKTVTHKNKTTTLTDRIDNILTDKWLGLPIFLLIMAAVFFLTFTVGGWMKGYFETGLLLFSSAFSNMLYTLNVSPVLCSLLLDGIIAGVGGILTFLPNIFILFLCLSFLEDSGYMARIAYVMDGIMGKIGLSGKAFIPMVLGFGCTVPAIMASRTLENKRDRFKTMLVTPFISCSARLPIYILFAEMFFPSHAMLTAYSMYVLGIGVAIFTVLLIRIFGKNQSSSQPLLIELPDYKLPGLQNIRIYVLGKIKEYLTRAGTVIFIASILMWILLHFGPAGYTADITATYGSLLGEWLIPYFAPLGLGYWQIILAVIAGISAKEVVVSSCVVLFAVENITTAAGISSFSAILRAMGFGPANALSMMVFCLLYIPCIAALATIKKESKSWPWMLFSAGFQITAAWLVSFVVYRLALLVL